MVRPSSFAYESLEGEGGDDEALGAMVTHRIVIGDCFWAGHGPNDR